MTEKMKQYYHYKANGICVNCGQYDAVTGKTLCEVCAAKKCDQNERYRLSPSQKKRYAENARRKRVELKAAGLCVQCGNPQAKSSTSYCFSCLVRKRENARRRQIEKSGHALDRTELPDYGICTMCCKNPAEEGQRTCVKCHAKLVENLKIARGQRNMRCHKWRKG